VKGGRDARYTPQSQLRTFTARTAIPRSGGNAGQRLFGAGFAVREAVAADHDCNETCNLRNGAGEKTLDRVEARVEW
jgi:hypothetical protein